MPASRALSLARARGTTLTEYLAALYMFCLGRLYEAEARASRRPARSIVRLEVPVNMRRFLPSATMRNFSLYVSPEVDLRSGHYSLEELASRVHHSMQMEVDRRELSRQITRNVGAELRPVIRATPLFVKDILLGWMYCHLSARIYSGATAALAMFLLALDLLMPGKPWFLTLALPLSVLAGALTGAVYAAAKALKPRIFAILAVVLASAGLFVPGLEAVVNLYCTGTLRLSWSLVVFGCVAPLVGLLLYIQYRLKATRKDMRKIFHL